MPIISLSNVCKSYGGQVVLAGLNQRFYAGEKVGMTGVNGSGKTTVLKMAAGLVEPDSGKVSTRKGLRVGYVPQEVRFEQDLTVTEQMHAGMDSVIDLHEKLERLGHRLKAVEGKELTRAMDEYERLTRLIELEGGYEYEVRIRKVLASLNLGPDTYDKRTSTLSGGQLSRLALAKALLCETDVLLLDEPTNHLDLQATVWLEKFLRSYGGAVIIVSHDRYLLDSLAEKIVEIEGQKASEWPGNYSNFVHAKQTSLLNQQRQYRQRVEMVERTRDFIARNKDQEGMRKTARGRKTRLKRLLKEKPDFLEKPRQTKIIGFGFSETNARGDIVLRAEGISKSYGRIVLFERLDLDVQQGDRWGITGPNGAGKSTLIKILLGIEAPDEGMVKRGKSLTIGYLDQQGMGLNQDNTVLQEVKSVRPDMTEEALRSRLGAFLFTGDDVFKKVWQLSGGQQSRVSLCKLALAEPDLLLLDEPTNHLDIASREAMEQALEEYNGTIIAVSHDRFFLDKVADNLLVVGTDRLGQICTGRSEPVPGPKGYRGAYSRYIERLEQRSLDEAAKIAAENKKQLKPRQKNSCPAPVEIRTFNKYTLEQIEKMITKAEDELARLNEEFCDERIYQSHLRLAGHKQKIETAQSELELLYRAYEHRLSK